MVTPSRMFALALALFVSFSSLPAFASSKDGAGSTPPAARAEELPTEVVFPPDDATAAAPVTVFLHGMCDTPENECPYFRRAVGRRGWLVCPRAPVACGGGSKWGGKGDAALIEAAVQRLVTRYPDRVVTSDRTVIGFSQGAFVAAELLQHGEQPYRYALLMAGKVPVVPARVLRGGALRVLLSAGDRDGSSAFMQDAARRLARGGVDARYFSLGNVGHSFAADMDTWLDGALAWLWAPGHSA